MNKKQDEKDLELVMLGRESETFQMQGEETLTYFDEMRTNRDEYKKLSEENSNLAQENQYTIDRLINEHE